jgi:hypothetical protein
MPNTPIPVAAPVKQPRHVAIAIKHLNTQRDKAVAVRNKAAKEVEDLDAALFALSGSEE